MLTINHKPSPLVLRWFGLIQSLLLAALGGLVYWRYSASAAAPIWFLAVVFAIVYYSLPRLLRRGICVGLQYVAWPFSALIALVVLGVIYFGLFTVTGLFLRVFGYDPLRRRFDRSAKTYWTPRERVAAKKSYFQQF